jgi:hypothetical protein
MKPTALSFGLLIALGSVLRAQDAAPSSLAGKTAVVVISTGNGSFASVGGYRVSFAAVGPDYAISPLSTTVSPSRGTYSYVKTGAGAGRVRLNEAGAGSSSVQSLVFSSPTSATYSISSSAGEQTGTFVLEDIPSMNPSRVCFANMSVRAQVLAGAQVIPGLVVDSPCRVLIRVVGPSLAEFGVSGVLPNPRFSLMVGDRVVLANDDWSSTISNYDAVRVASDKAGAFPIRFGSRDAAIVADLSAGSYTCVITGEPGTSGEVLLEVYRVP